MKFVQNIPHTSKKSSPGFKKKSYALSIHPFLSFILFFTVLFFTISLCVFYPFYSHNLTLVWEADGATQYILWLQYSGAWLKNAAASLLTGHPEFPFYDFSIGWGSDVHAFLKTDPVLLVGSLFVNNNNIAIIYTILTILRIYLTGFSFGVFAVHKKLSIKAAVIGAIVYAFSGYTFYYIFRHPQFALGAIYLPLLLTGISRTIHQPSGTSKLFFPFITALSLFSGYYFHYMNTIVLCIYLLITISFEQKDKSLFSGILNCILEYAIGCGMASIIFFPSVSSYFFSDRNVLSDSSYAGHILSIFKEQHMLFSAGGAKELPASIITPANTSYGPASFFVCVLILPAFISLFTYKYDLACRAKQKKTAAALIITLSGLCIPAITRLFTGFGTDYNRWSYIAVFVFAYAIACQLEHLPHFTKNGLFLSLIFIGVYIALYFMKYLYEDVYLISFILAVIPLIYIILSHFMVSLKKYTISLCLGIGFISIAWGGYHYNTIQSGFVHSAFLGEKEVQSYYLESPYQTAAKIDDPSFYRVDTADLDSYELNGATAANVNGITYYNSTINQSVISWMKHLETTGLQSINLITGIDQRSSLENMLSVKYLIVGPGRNVKIPFHFIEDKKLEAHLETHNRIYVNQNSTSIGYTYESAVSDKEYANWSPLERQEALLQYAVLPEKETGDNNAKYETSHSISTLPFKITKTDRLITKEGNIYTVDSSDYDDPYLSYYEAESISDLTGIHFHTRAEEHSELYIRFTGLSVKDQTASLLTVNTPDVHAVIPLQNKKSDYYTGMKDYTVCLGYYDQPQDISGVISFTNDDIYTIDTIQAYAVSMDKEQAYMEKRNQGNIENVQLSSGSILCSLSDSNRPYVVFSIPYQKGWTAYVDNKKVPVYRCNDGFLGLIIKEARASSHTIRLRYIPYGLLPGAFLTVISFCFLFLYIKKGNKR